MVFLSLRLVGHAVAHFVFFHVNYPTGDARFLNGISDQMVSAGLFQGADGMVFGVSVQTVAKGANNTAVSAAVAACNGLVKGEIREGNLLGGSCVESVKRQEIVCGRSAKLTLGSHNANEPTALVEGAHGEADGDTALKFQIYRNGKLMEVDVICYEKVPSDVEQSIEFKEEIESSKRYFLFGEK